MMTEDKILLTARFVEGDMSKTESDAYELRLESDLTLKKHLKDYKNIHQTLKMHIGNVEIDEKFKLDVREIGNPYFAEGPAVISFRPFKKWLPAVAAVMVVGLMLWAPWNQDIYERYADNGQMLVTERGAEKQTNLDVAAAFFNDKKYVEAERLLEKEYLVNPNNEMVGYYFGITLIENKKGDVARTVLSKIYEGQSAFKYDAAYYVALSFLKEDKNADCRLWLQKIPAGTTHYKQAIELIQKL